MLEWQRIQLASIVKVIAVIMVVIDIPMQVQFQANHRNGTVEICTIFYVELKALVFKCGPDWNVLVFLFRFAFAF